MRGKMKIVGVCAAMALGWSMAGCGDDDGGNTNHHDAMVQTDAAPDAAVQADAAPDATVQADAALQGCTGEPATEPGGQGACCATNEDCAIGRCLTGWCSETGCAEDADCDPTVAGLFPAGTPTRCMELDVGNYVDFCVPGSLQPCGATGDAACPAGEACALGWNPDAQDLSEALHGLCVTSIQQAGTLATGETCLNSESTLPDRYRCEAAGLLANGCLERRCTEVCDVTDPDACPAGMECVGPASLGSGITGAGLCAGTSCGHAQFTGDDQHDVRIPGDPAGCPDGEVCGWYPFSWGLAGDTIEYRCLPSEPSAAALGAACEHSAKFALPCDNWSFCLQAAAVYTHDGDTCTADEDCAAEEVCVEAPSIGPKRCSPKSEPGVCSQPCRMDADCPDLDGGPSVCLQLSLTLPSGAAGYLTGCIPWSRVTDEAPVFCETNADCNADVGEGCVVVSYQSSQKVCLPHVTQDAAGVDCSVGGVADCQAGEACVENTTAGTFRCTAYQAFGDPCDPEAPHACRGGSCLDIDYQSDDGGTPTNTYCHGWCLSNADCGPEAVCDDFLMAENDPATTADDVSMPHCRTMRVRSGAGCAAPGDCATGDGCDVPTGRCYTSAAAWGDACADHADCPQNGLCNLRVPGGMCYRPGCDPADGNAGCDGTGSCSDAQPVALCLEDCTGTGDCSRSGEGFSCVQGACLAP